ncbi:hypothetical protein ACA910_016607 [Epithemia clementina (nom. ined.)]
MDAAQAATTAASFSSCPIPPSSSSSTSAWSVLQWSVQTLVEGWMRKEWTIQGIVEAIQEQVRMVLVDTPLKIWNAIPRDAMVPLLVVVVVFWPLLVSLLYAFMTASTWMIWLLTSFLLGILQVLYVTYQFVMITIDLCGLSLLKSYSMARHLVLSYLLAIKKKSRRRLWQERLKNAGSYENFLKIRIEPKDEQEVFQNGGTVGGGSRNHNAGGRSNHSSLGGNNKQANSKLLAQRDPALPPLRPIPTRSNSFDNNNSSSKQGTASSSLFAESTSTTPPYGAFPRVRSLGHLSNHAASAATASSSSSSPSLFRHQPSFAADGSEFWTQAVAAGNSPTSSPTNNNINQQSHGAADVGVANNQNDTIDPVVSHELGERTAYLLVTTTERLLDARRQAERSSEWNNREKEEEAWNRLKYLLAGVVKRNHLHLDNILVENARTVSFSGRYGLTSQSRQVIRAFYEQVQKGLDFLADGPSITTPHQQPPPPRRSSSTNRSDQDDGDDDNNNNNNNDAEEPLLASAAATDTTTDGTTSPPSSTSSISLHQQDYQNEELSDRLRVLRKMKHNMGRTALMLSGGGAQAMYHVGIIRALIQSKLYPDISVISGTSGGSIIAAMCAKLTPEELFQKVCVPTVSTDFTLTGEQKRKNIRWFPSAMQMASYWFKHKYLVSSAEFRRTCEFYYGDTTFEEAFDRTGKHVCITVSASRTNGDSASQRLLLNHISTPRVTLASAVAASCALPGVMTPAKLLTKNSSGELELFEVDGVEWIDGSVQADLPFQRIATLFAVTNFIVSQTNFHIVPFLNKEHHPNQKSLYWRLFQTMEWDIRSRALKLSRLGLFPRIFGQDISKVFKQKYHGNLTIVPRFTTMQTFGLHALSNPTAEDMKNYIKYGEIATWPYLNAIRDMIRLEKVIDDCLNRLEHRLGTLNPEWYDDIESITSSNIHHPHNHHHFSSSLRSGVGGSTTIVSLSSISSNHHHQHHGPQRMVKYGRAGTGSSLASASRNGGGGGAGDERIRRKAKKLEEENKALKEKLQQLQLLLQGSGIATTPQMPMGAESSAN